MSDRVLSSTEINRAVLARQRLLEPGDGPIPALLSAVGGLQAQYAPSMYVGLRSRMRHVERDELTQALHARTVVQATLMRMTIHLVARADYWPLALAVREPRRAAWLDAQRPPIGAAAMIEAARLVRGWLAQTGEPVHRRQLDALVGRERALGSGLWLDLVRVPPSGTWERRRADLFAAAEDWIGPPPPGLTSAQAVAELVRGYLAGFGPASRADVASYTGLRQRDLAPAYAALELRSFASETGEQLLDVPDGPLPDPATPAPPRLLGHWDATLLVHARRAAILPERHRPRIFATRKPHSEATFLIDGAVAGTWRQRDGRIELEPFEPLRRSDRRALDAAAARMTRLWR